MVLSNAERQARYRRNLKARAMGVTAADVIAATEAMYRYIAHVNAEPDAPSWEAFLAGTRKRDGERSWRQWFADPFDDDLCNDMNAAGFDGELVRRVWPVAYAVLKPPVTG